MLRVGQVWQAGLYKIQVIFIELPKNFGVKCLATGNSEIWRLDQIHVFHTKGFSAQECANFLIDNGWKPVPIGFCSLQEQLASCNRCSRVFPCLNNGLKFLCYLCEILQ